MLKTLKTKKVVRKLKTQLKFIGSNFKILLEFLSLHVVATHSLIAKEEAERKKLIRYIVMCATVTVIIFIFGCDWLCAVAGSWTWKIIAYLSFLIFHLSSIRDDSCVWVSMCRTYFAMHFNFLWIPFSMLHVDIYWRYFCACFFFSLHFVSILVHSFSFSS